MTTRRSLFALLGSALAAAGTLASCQAEPAFAKPVPRLTDEQLQLIRFMSLRHVLRDGTTFQNHYRIVRGVEPDADPYGEGYRGLIEMGLLRKTAPWPEHAHMRAVGARHYFELTPAGIALVHRLWTPEELTIRSRPPEPKRNRQAVVSPA